MCEKRQNGPTTAGAEMESLIRTIVQQEIEGAFDLLVGRMKSFQPTFSSSSQSELNKCSSVQHSKQQPEN